MPTDSSNAKCIQYSLLLILYCLILVLSYHTYFKNDVGLSRNLYHSNEEIRYMISLTDKYYTSDAGITYILYTSAQNVPTTDHFVLIFGVSPSDLMSKEIFYHTLLSLENSHKNDAFNRLANNIIEERSIDVYLMYNESEENKDHLNLYIKYLESIDEMNELKVIVIKCDSIILDNYIDVPECDTPPLDRISYSNTVNNALYNLFNKILQN